jgi:hypothetical protein
MTGTDTRASPFEPMASASASPASAPSLKRGRSSVENTTPPSTSAAF